MDIQAKTEIREMHELSILVFGVGGCGVHVVQSMSGAWNSHFNGYLVDTDAQALAIETDASKIHLNTRTTQGMSCAGEVTAGMRALNEHHEELADLCSTADIIFIVAGFGGGTGTGGANALAETASDAGALVLGFVTMPFDFEGPERRAAAQEGLRTFRNVVDGVVVVENQRLLTLASDKTSVQSAFRVVSDVVSRNVTNMQKLLALPGIVNIDFADVRRMVMNSHGVCTMVSAEAEGDQRSTTVVAQVLDHPLFCGQDVLRKSAAVIVGICAGDSLTLREMETIMSRLCELTGPGTRIKMGTSLDPSLNNKLSLLVLASECDEERTLACAEKAGSASTAQQQPPDRGEGGKKKTKVIQSSLNLESPGKGRFKDVEPTLRNGEDLDVPTFIRRGIRINS